MGITTGKVSNDDSTLHKLLSHVLQDMGITTGKVSNDDSTLHKF